VSTAGSRTSTDLHHIQLRCPPRAQQALAGPRCVCGGGGCMARLVELRRTQRSRAGRGSAACPAGAAGTPRGGGLWQAPGGGGINLLRTTSCAADVTQGPKVCCCCCRLQGPEAWRVIRPLACACPLTNCIGLYERVAAAGPKVLRPGVCVIVYQEDRNRWPEALVCHPSIPHQQRGLPPNCTRPSPAAPAVCCRCRSQGPEARSVCNRRPPSTTQGEARCSHSQPHCRAQRDCRATHASTRQEPHGESAL
jgi:hypothetical protein